MFKFFILFSHILYGFYSKHNLTHHFDLVDQKLKVKPSVAAIFIYCDFFLSISDHNRRDSRDRQRGDRRSGRTDRHDRHNDHQRSSHRDRHSRRDAEDKYKGSFSEGQKKAWEADSDSEVTIITV